MTSIRLPLEIENRFKRLCIITHRSKSFYIREALLKYIDDMEDLYISLERIASPQRKFLTTEEVLKKL